MARNLIGMYRDIDRAERVVQQLLDLGVSRDHISVVSHDASNKYRDLSTMSDKHREENAARGAGGGAIAGAIGGALLSIGLAALPGIGWILAAGPIGSILATGAVGAAVGAAAGGVGGALSLAGVPDRQAGDYAEAIRRGGTLVAVEVPDGTDADEIGDVMERMDPIDIDKSSKRWREREGWTGYDAKAAPFAEHEARREREHWNEETREVAATPTPAPKPPPPPTQARAADTQRTVPIVEETVDVGKRAVVRGGARIHVYPVVERIERDVKLREERVDVGRRPVNRPLDPDDADDAFHDQTFEFVETGEEAVVEKTPRVVEEVRVDKRVEDRTQHVSETARHTQVDVERLGTEDLAAHETSFREHFGRTSGARGGQWNQQYRDAYQIGFQLARDEKYRGRGTFEQFAAEARTRWAADKSHTLPFDDVKDAIAFGYESGRTTKA